MIVLHNFLLDSDRRYILYQIFLHFATNDIAKASAIVVEVMEELKFSSTAIQISERIADTTLPI